MKPEPAIVIEMKSLSVLAEEVRSAHSQCRQALAKSIEYARSAGQSLIAAKEQLKHGAWLPWLQEHCGLSARHAQNYMRIARNFHVLESKNAAVADLTISDALFLLAKPDDIDDVCARGDLLAATWKVWKADYLTQVEAIETAGTPEQKLRFYVDIAKVTGQFQNEFAEIRLKIGRHLGGMLTEAAIAP